MRPSCVEKDEMVYYTFWPLISFSFFIASDSLLFLDALERTEHHSTFLAASVILRTVTHAYSIGTLIISMLEAYVAYAHLGKTLCTRLMFLEINSVIAALALILLSYVDVIHPILQADEPLSSTGMFLSGFIPFTIFIITLVYQIVRIFFHYGFLKIQFK